ncbi:hypothetical protein J3R83DRAFT_13220 [Lanmaoa asiatica]|nr:hypothetical protein J3R83DRAFT_13220 [Lanmaoa asiatica]
MDQLGGDMDQGMGESTLPADGGDGGEKRAVESGAANGLGASTCEGVEGEGERVDSLTSGSGDSANVNEASDVRMQGLEEGEVDPNEAPMLSTRIPETPESGEIRSQESGREVRTAAESKSPSSGPVAPVLRFVSGCRGKTHTDVHCCAFGFVGVVGRRRLVARVRACRSRLGTRGTLVMPDISSYKGVRFKRPLSEARENSFFSRALNGAARSGKAPVGVGGKSASGGVPAPVEVPSSIGEVQSQDGDAGMRDGAATLMPDEASRVSLEAAVSSNATAISATTSRSADGAGHAKYVLYSTGSTIDRGAKHLMTPSQPPPATQPLARESSRPFIAPPRVPRPSAPMSLIEALNESSQSTRAFGRTPSLNDIRTLLARRNVGADQPSRSTSASTPTPTFAFSEDGDDHAPAEPAEPAAVLAPRSTDSKDGASSEGTGTKSGVLSTPTLTTTTGSASRSGGPSSVRRRKVSFVPFEAFISPVQSRGGDIKNDHNEQEKGEGKKSSGDKGKGEEIPDVPDVTVSPTAARSRASMGGSLPLLDSQRKVRRHGRRESASAFFQAYIVRDSPKQTTGARTGTDTDKDAWIGAGVETGTGTEELPPRPGIKPVPQPQSPGRLRFSESISASSPVISDVHADTVLVTVPASDVGGDGHAEDTNAMHADTGDDCIGSTSADDGVMLCEDEGEGEPETTGEGETDEVDMLLELASVHLSQTVAEADEGREMDVIDELVGSFEAEPAQETGGAMVVDGPLEDLEMSGGDEGETVPQTVLDAALSPPGQTKVTVPPEDIDTIASEELLAEENVLSMRVVASEERVVQSIDPVETSSHVTTPNLILPEDDSSSSVELPSTSKDSDQNAAHGHFGGGADSMDKCDALLTVRAGCESEPEVMPVDSITSSRTASSTSLVPPRPLLRSSHGDSKQKSCPRTTTSADSLDPLRHSTHASDQAKDESTPEHFGGHRVVTWASYVAEERERAPEYKLAKNIPHSLQDNMNALPASFRQSDVARKIFQAHIREAMTNEPDAPSIEIFDNGIGSEVTPMWEFHYTNDMWYGEGVPPPDVKGLESCGCVGRCDPKSGKCACAQRQLRWVQQYIDGEIIPPTWAGSPFVYDHRGMLQRLECPIFECNRFCACDEDCPNRVVQNGRKWPVHIAKTTHKGWGVFSGNKKIPKGSYIGIYAGELLTEQEGEARGKYYDMYGRTYLFSVDFHHLKQGIADPDDWENLYVVDAYHSGNNHSCDPNCKIFACYIDDADVDKPLLAVFTTREVEPWEELCFSYYGDIDEKREEIEEAKEAGEEMTVRDHAVYARCQSQICAERAMALRLLLALSLLPAALALWPIPAALDTGTASLILDPGFYFDIAIHNAPFDLYDAVAQAQYYLQNDKLGRLVVGRGANDSAALTNAPSLPSLQLTLTSGAPVDSISSESVKPFGMRSEEYVLTIPADGHAATLTANSTLGLYRGLTTFGQLWYYYGGKTYTLQAPITIMDAPAYPFRGFALDTSRNFFPLEYLLRTLDAMSWVKINTFHWHITDSQSFPLEVAQYPELAANGAYSAEETYSESDVQYIVQYAAAVLDIVPQEVDTPGHTAIIGTSYPNYVACFDASPWATYANEPPAGQLRFALPEVVNFTTSLLRDIASTLPSNYFSTGGDELNTNCYAHDIPTQQQLNSTNTTLVEALATFTQSTHSALIARGKTPVVWEEMVLQWNLTLSKETIIMVWISSEDAAAVANLGYRIVQAPSNYFYLDCGAGQWLGDDPTGNSWCDPFKTWSESYTFDPLANLTESQYPLVLGGEQLLWAEQSGPQNLDPIVWPRAASSAEIFWSAKQPTGAPLNVTEALPRLHDVRYRMVQRGVNAIPLQPQWCALRPDACDLYA